MPVDFCGKPTTIATSRYQASSVEAVYDRPFSLNHGKCAVTDRAIDDGRFYATIVDVVVSPSHHRKGVGRAIVEDLQSRLNGFLIVTLTAAPDVQAFYRRLGWLRQTTAMLRPRSKEQASLNCLEE
jgi:GNAT superfamily N-acetyltransferase